MPNPTNVTDAIEQAALAGVESVAVESVNVRAMDIKKQISIFPAKGQSARTALGTVLRNSYPPVQDERLECCPPILHLKRPTR